MKTGKWISGVVSFMLCLGLISCAQQAKTANSGEAIEQAKQLSTNEEKIKFLVSEANAFINSQKFDESIKTAQYILSNLDKSSSEAQSIIETAKTEIKKLAEVNLEKVKGDLKGKIGNLGQ